MDSFKGVLTSSMEKFRTINEQGLTFNTIGGRIANMLRLMTHGLKGFRMEMLGVLFFGMQMQRMFLNMMQPALDSLGVFELWRVMLMTVFLPILIELLPLFLDFVNFFINLDENTKKAIGVLAILGVILGTILIVVGQFALGIGSIIQLFGGFTGISAIIEGISTLFAGLSATVLVVAAVIIAIIIGMILAWQENFAGFRDWVAVLWDGIKDLFMGVWNIIAGIFKIFMSLIKGDTEGLIEGLKQIWEGLKLFLVGLIKVVIGIIMTLAIGVFRVFIGIYTVIYGLFEMLFDAAGETFNNIKNKIIEILTNTKDKALEIFDSIIEKIRSVIDWISKAISKLNIFNKDNEEFNKDGGESNKDGGESTTSTASSSRFNDFLFRPGQAPISFSPDDTIVEFKNTPGNNALGGGANVTFSPTTNINVSDKAEMERLINDNNRKQVDDLKRLVKVPV
jgi:phage-related protein